MTAPQQGALTFEELCEATGSKEASVRKALRELGILPQRDLSDRRRTVYPADTVERVQQWLQANGLQYR